MKKLALLLQAHRTTMVSQAQEALSEFNWEAPFQLPSMLSSEIFAGIFQNIERDLESKQIGHYLTQFCTITFGKKLPFKLNLHQQQVILITARSILDRWLLETYGPDRQDFQHKVQTVHRIFDNTFIRLSQQWDWAFQRSRRDDQTLIEELKLVKNGIQKQLNALYQIIKASPIGVIGCDKDLTIRFWNPTAVRLTGFQQADILKKNLLQIFPVESQDQFLKKIHSDHKWSTRLRLNIQCKNGDSFPALVSISEIDSNGFHYLINFMDLSGEEIIQSQVRRINQLTAIARLSGAIMHDIRNPVNSIGLNVDLIEQLLEQNNIFDANIRDLLDKIHHQIDHLTYILNQYLGYSRLAELKPEPLTLSAKLTDLILEMRVENASKNIKINYRPPKNDWLILGDWAQLRRAFVNLIQNAIQAMQENGIIWVKIYKRRHRILITIQDTGPGIEPNQIKKIFQPFYSTKRSGAGLGLFIVREIVHAHRGRISCTSKSGEGAQFTISFPIYQNSN